ncbi:MAG TPA: hypothetical protein PKD12_15635 [Nitrospira sp.]|nr:hypothetical protein [Nitrospira sp.]
MIADDFPRMQFVDGELQALSAAEITELLISEGLNANPTPDVVMSVAADEQRGVIYDIDENCRFKQTDKWQPFVNAWMEMMWAMKQQRNYVKLALVLQSISKRDGWISANGEDDFEAWVGLAKRCQGRYFSGVASLLLVLFIALGALAGTAKAATEDATIVYLGTEVIDTNGVPTINNAYKVDCDGEDLTVTIEITFADGAVQLRTSDDYCGAKILLEGAIASVDVVAVASGPQVVKFVYLPVVAR